jgi:hypothetical protein
MPLFITNSKPLSRRRAQATRALLGFALIFSSCFSAGWWLLAHRSSWTATDSIPPSASIFDQTVLFQTIDQPYTTEYAFYHGVGPAIAWARRANSVIVGNSQSLAGLRGKSIGEAEEKSGLSFYNLSEARNNFLFVDRLFQTQRLAPSLVLVNVPGFFDLKLHPVLKATMRVSDGRAWMEVYAHSLSWFVRAILQQWIPKWTLFRPSGVIVAQEPRDAKNGFLFESFEPPPSGQGGLLDFKPQTPVKMDPALLKRAAEFKRDMEARGSRIILMHVPSHEDPAVTEELARELQVPFIIPRLKGMTSRDNMHLDRESAERFSRVFFRRLLELSEVKSLEERRPASSGDER